MSDIWDYEPAVGHTPGLDLVGFSVEAIDGGIGKVDKHSDDVGAAYIVVDTGPWIFGRHALLPAGTVSTVDATTRTVYLSRTKQDVQEAPEFDKDNHLEDADYHRSIASYYGRPVN